MLSEAAIAAQQQHRRALSLSCTIASERDDDLTLFREMQRRERERKVSIPEEPGMQTPRTACKSMDQSLHRMAVSSSPIKCGDADDLFLSDLDKNDYDWLMTPPGTPLFLTESCYPINNGLPCVGAASDLSAHKTSRLGGSKSEPLSRAEPSSKCVRGNLGLQQPLNLNAVGSASSAMASKSVLSAVPRSSTQGLNSARPSTTSSIHMLRHVPTGASSYSKPSANPGALHVTMQIGGVRAAPSLARTTIPNGRSACSSRPSTPVKRPPSPDHPCNPPTTLVRCSSANRASSMLSKEATLSRPCSLSSKTCIPEAVNGFSQEPPPNLRTSMLERSLSTSRGSLSKTCQMEQSDTGVRSRRQSGSPTVARGRTSTALQKGVKGFHRNGKVDDGTVEMPATNGSASKVGEKAVRAKKPTMCAQEGQGSLVDSHVKKPVKSTPLRDVKSIISSVRESSGIGRSLSKKSLDLASRHMDICKATPYKFRSLMSSMSKPSPSTKESIKKGTFSTSSVMDSPMATSSSASSEHNMSIVIDPEGSELGDESVSEKGSRSSAASQHDLFSLGREKRISSWLRNPDYRDDDADIMQIFEQEGLESLSGPESPLISEIDGTIECDNFCLDPI